MSQKRKIVSTTNEYKKGGPNPISEYKRDGTAEAAREKITEGPDPIPPKPVVPAIGTCPICDFVDGRTKAGDDVQCRNCGKNVTLA